MAVLGILMGLAIWSGVLFPPALALYALVKWRGRWRVAAAMPLVALLAFFLPLIPDWMHDPSHNLWGLVFLPLAMLLAIYSGVVVILYRRRIRL